MPARLVALEEGEDIPLDRAMIVVGRHPGCDSRLESLRISRHHCCMTLDCGEIEIRDLGSTNGIRINGQRVETGRLKPGDELSIAHIRYRYEKTPTVDSPPPGDERRGPDSDEPGPKKPDPGSASIRQTDSDPELLAEAVRKLLPAHVADKCKIQVIVKMGSDSESGQGGVAESNGNGRPVLENAAECHSDLSL